MTTYPVGLIREYGNGSIAIEGFGFRPQKDFIYVAWFGLPNISRSESDGGILFPDPGVGGTRDDAFCRYQMSMWRFGIVVAKGPGYWGVVDVQKGPRRTVKKTVFLRPPPELNLGDVVMFSRKFGTRLPNDHRVKIPAYERPLLIRVLDSSQCIAAVDDFEPWWNVEECQEDPGGIMTG